MKSINKLKLDKSVTNLLLFVKNENNTPHSATPLHKNKWRKEYNSFVNGLEVTGDKLYIYLMDVDNNQCKAVLFEDTLNF